MSSVYVHIPFCAGRCVYCDFYSGADNALQNKYVDTLIKELKMRLPELSDTAPNSLYIGGGTPSRLSPKLLSVLFDGLSLYLDLSSCKEITMEVNPDDITTDYLAAVAGLPINRISMGVQSFNDIELQFLKRRHTSVGAIDAFNLLRNNGYENISIDLIFSIPGQTLDIWQKNIDMALSLSPEHISAYDLIYENGTSITRKLEAGEIEACSEDLSCRMYQCLVDTLSENGYEHYEVSNFARRGFRSKHNSGYWSGEPYLGLGASSHSYDGFIRRANVSDAMSYIDSISRGFPAYTAEVLTETQRYDEMVYTRLRTSGGLSLSYIEEIFGYRYSKYCMSQSQRYIKSGDLSLKGDILVLTRKGVLLSDAICRDLFYEE